ncbi:MAG TPA: hypothetical protein DCY51_07585 [Bacteroidetes bacterium]|nr:hypothetical protein [Bacteroidota bacterium]
MMKNTITMSNQDIISYAKNKVSQNWGLAIVGSLVYAVITSIASMLSIGVILVSGPLSLGYAYWSLFILRKDRFEVEHLFDGFKNFVNALVTYLLMILLVFAWTLLLIVPGIIKALAYSQAIFILADEPETKGMDALRKSEAMMKGNKTKYFLMGLLFLLLGIACIFTLGIGFLFLAPVIQVSLAKFYDEVRRKYTGESIESEIDEIGTLEVE